MNHKIVSVPELALVAGTRVALGIGIGLLLADEWKASQRRTVGGALFAIGALATIPLAMRIFSRKDASECATALRSAHSDRDEELSSSQEAMCDSTV